MKSVNTIRTYDYGKENEMEHKKGFYEKYIKRPQDFFCALFACIILSPVMLVIAILVKIKIGSPVLFTQERPGLNGEIFKLYKFRTMSNKRDENGNLLPDEKRLTSFGKKLRSTSLDELPELGSILIGDMAIIGPRPLLPRDVKYMTSEQKMRHSVRPGLTGLAQCNGRNSLNWDTKLAIDTEYVRNISFLLDLKIFIQTILKVIKREGITFEEGADMDLKDWNELKNKKKNEEQI